MKNLFIFTKKKAFIMMFFVIAYVISSVLGFLIVQNSIRISTTPDAYIVNAYVPAITSLLFFIILYIGIYFVFTKPKLTKSRFSKSLAPVLATLTTWFIFKILFEIFQLPLSQFAYASNSYASPIYVIVGIIYLIAIFVAAMYIAISLGVELSYPSDKRR